MRGRLVVCAFLSVAGTPATAQSIRVGPVAEAAREAEPRRFSEPHLAIQPGAPTHLLAAAFIVPATGTTEQIHAGERCVTLASRDGGSTWTRHEFPFADCGDPQVAILPDGQAVFVALAEMPGLSPKRGNWLFAMHSPDGGFTWDESPTILGRQHDHSALAVDVASTMRTGWIYVTTHHEPRDGNGRLASRLFIARSRDQGKSFDAATTVRPNNLHTFGEMPVVMADGTVVASFVDDVETAPSLSHRRAWVVRSLDGATAFSEPLFVNDACGPPPGFQLSALPSMPRPVPFAIDCISRVVRLTAARSSSRLPRIAETPGIGRELR